MKNQLTVPQYMVIPVFVAAQAAGMMLLAPYIKVSSGVLGAELITWVAFQAWAMYFVGGSSIMGMKVFCGYTGGMVASIAIFELGDLFSWAIGGYFGYALAVFIVVIGVISSEHIRAFDFTPAWFIGSGTFFAFMGPYIRDAIPHTVTGYLTIAVPVLVAVVLGLLFGWATIEFRKRYEKFILVR